MERTTGSADEAHQMSYAAPSNFTLHDSRRHFVSRNGRSVSAHHDCFHYRQQVKGDMGMKKLEKKQTSERCERALELKSAICVSLITRYHVRVRSKRRR
jgi:hypothetical protein